MSMLIPAILTVCCLLIILSTSTVLLLLWNNARRVFYLYYCALLLALIAWIFASLFLRLPPTTAATSIGRWPVYLLEAGFAGTIITSYLLTTRLTDVHGRAVRSAVLLGISLLVIYRLAFVLLGLDIAVRQVGNGLLYYNFSQAAALIYLIFSLSVVFITWRNARRLDHPLIRYGLLALGISQTLALISPQLRAYALAESTNTAAVLLIGYGMVQQDVMLPLQGRKKQLEVIRDVGLAMTSELASDEVLSAIAQQAANLLQADGSAIYLKQDERLVLEAVYNIPAPFIGYELTPGQGLAGTVSQTRQAQLLQDYRRQWQGAPDMPLAFESFGSVIGVPLHFHDAVVGVLLVVEGRAGRLFTPDDLQLLSLIGPQAAVSIINSWLFEQERALRDEVVAAKQQLEAVLTNTENPVLALNRQWEVLFANPAAETLLQAHTGQSVDIYAQPLVTYLDDELLPDTQRFMQDLLHRHAHVYEVNINHHDYLCHITWLRRPMRGWVVVLNDVTKLKEVDRLKSQMVRMTSHDLKNPLFAVITYMELLEDDGAAIFDENMQHYVQSIWKQLTRMQRIISGILDLEKIQSGAPSLNACDIGALLWHSTDEIKDQALKKGLTFEQDIAPDLPPIIGDTQQLEQAFFNLLDNAIKYTPEGGQVWLRAYQQASTIIIEIEDTGIGIPREVQNQVFDRFFRVQSQPSASSTGSGLGLSLVKSIIDHHKGRVWLRSEAGQGSTFYIALPIAPQEHSVGV